jgi:hypothetical protein
VQLHSRASSPDYVPLQNTDAADSQPVAPHFSPAALRQQSSSAAAAASCLTLPADRGLQVASRGPACDPSQGLLAPFTADQPLATLHTLPPEPAAAPPAEQQAALQAEPAIVQQESRFPPAGTQQAPIPVSSLAEAYREAAWTGAGSSMPWAGPPSTSEVPTTSALQPEQDRCSLVPVQHPEQSRGLEAASGKAQQQRLKEAAQHLLSARTPQRQVVSFLWQLCIDAFNFPLTSNIMHIQDASKPCCLRSQGVRPQLRVVLEEVDPDAAPWLIIPSSPEASAVLPALVSWDVEPSATDMQITLDSHVVTLTTPAGDATASCKLQVSSLRQGNTVSFCSHGECIVCSLAKCVMSRC